MPHMSFGRPFLLFQFTCRDRATADERRRRPATHQVLSGFTTRFHRLQADLAYARPRRQGVDRRHEHRNSAVRRCRCLSRCQLRHQAVGCPARDLHRDAAYRRALRHQGPQGRLRRNRRRLQQLSAGTDRGRIRRHPRSDHCERRDRKCRICRYPGQVRAGATLSGASAHRDATAGWARDPSYLHPRRRWRGHVHQPTWDAVHQVPVGDQAEPHADTATSYANRHWYIDLGPDWAKLRILEMWTRYRPFSGGSHSGFAGMWWDNDADTIALARDWSASFVARARACGRSPIASESRSRRSASSFAGWAGRRPSRRRRS